MKNTYACFIVLVLAGAVWAQQEDLDLQAFMDAENVAQSLGCNIAGLEWGTLEGGAAVYALEHDWAFWVKDGAIYAVNERAKEAAPQAMAPPENITYRAVYTASCRPSHEDKRNMLIAMKGRELSEEDAQNLERVVQAQPTDIWARTMLLGFYAKRQFDSKEDQRSRQQHVLWLAANAPEEAVLGAFEAELDPYLNPAAYAEMATLMKAHVQKDPKNVRILANAARLLNLGEPDFAAQCLKTCMELEPDNPRWHEEMADIHLQKTDDDAGAGDVEAARQSLAERERALELTTKPISRMFKMIDLPVAAFDAGYNDKARQYANEALKNAKNVDELARVRLINTANTILGRIALKEGDTAKAIEHLKAAGNGGDARFRDIFEPEMDLARELLEKGEKDAVIAYLQMCGTFWDKEATDNWIEEIKSGKTPELDVMMAGLPDDVDVSAFSPYSPLVRMPLKSIPLRVLDAIYGLPLLAVLACLLVLRIISSRQHLWILAPLGFVYVVPLTVALAVPQLTVDLMGLDAAHFEHRAAMYFGSLALVWLLSDVLARLKPWSTALSVAVILSVGGSLGLVNFARGYDIYHITLAILAFIIVVIASFAAARFYCSRRYSRWRFLAFLLGFNVFFMMVVWPLLWTAIMVLVFDRSLLAIAIDLPTCLLIALVNGVGMFILLVPFLMLAFFVPLYNEQFAKILRLAQQ